MIGEYWIELTYLLASILFIFGLKGLSHPKTFRTPTSTRTSGRVRVPTFRLSPSRLLFTGV